jgi:hypothetical protein
VDPWTLDGLKEVSTFIERRHAINGCKFALITRPSSRRQRDGADQRAEQTTGTAATRTGFRYITFLFPFDGGVHMSQDAQAACTQ